MVVMVGRRSTVRFRKGAPVHESFSISSLIAGGREICPLICPPGSLRSRSRRWPGRWRLLVAGEYFRGRRTSAGRLGESGPRRGWAVVAAVRPRGGGLGGCGGAAGGASVAGR